MNSRQQRPLWNILILTIALLVIGTVGFRATAGLNYAEAFYTTLLLLLSHYSSYNFTDAGSRTLVILIIASSLVILAYLLKWFVEYMIGLGDNVRRRKMKSKAAHLKDHYIVCGLGRVGSQVAREMHNEGVKFVALDRDAALTDEAAKNGYIVLNMDSTNEEALIDAGIMQAQGLVASLGEDSLNLLVTLAARALNPNLYIVARANRQDNEIKLKRAGANRVALPYQIGGYHMASMVLRPTVVDYMDVISNSKGASGLEVEEMVVSEQSHLAGKPLGKSLAEGSIGATVIAINGADGSSRVRPSGKEIIYAGDRLIILGAKKDLTQASELIR